MFRIVVQDTRQTPTSGKVIAQIGHYDPHSKTVSVDNEKASFYLTNGAQPSDRAARLLQKEGVELPSWVKLSGERAKGIRNPEKLRKNQPKEEVAEEPVEAAEEKAEEATEAPTEAAPEAPEAEAPAEETAEEKTEEAKE